MTNRHPIPPRLIRELVRRCNPPPHEQEAWSQVYDDYAKETEWASASQHLDSYLAYTGRKRTQPTPDGYRQWIITGERMSRERFVREILDKREAEKKDSEMTPEQQALDQWRRDWCQ